MADAGGRQRAEQIQGRRFADHLVRAGFVEQATVYLQRLDAVLIQIEPVHRSAKVLRPVRGF